MENINEMFNDSTENSMYIEGTEEEKPKFIPIEPGEYTGHIKEYSSRIVEWTDKNGDSFKARVHNYKVELADNDNKEFNGRIFRSSGCFQFLEPKKDDKFISNQSGNKSYLRFCEDIGIDCTEVEREVDGETIKVKQLPNITEKDALGAPVIAVLNFGKSYKDKNGFTKKPMQVKFIKKWEGGERLEVKTSQEAIDDIPF
jgi:hypothetical protein